MSDDTTTATPPDPPEKVWVGQDKHGAWCAIAPGCNGPETALVWIVGAGALPGIWHPASDFGPPEVVRVLRAWARSLTARAVEAEQKGRNDHDARASYNRKWNDVLSALPGREPGDFDAVGHIERLAARVTKAEAVILRWGAAGLLTEGQVSDALGVDRLKVRELIDEKIAGLYDEVERLREENATFRAAQVQWNALHTELVIDRGTARGTARATAARYMGDAMQAKADLGKSEAEVKRLREGITDACGGLEQIDRGDVSSLSEAVECAVLTLEALRTLAGLAKE